MMKIAIMQPYILPYLGYFHLINAVDKFVFYDDVNFIKGGWINRNRIYSKSGPVFFNVLLENKSSFEKINKTRILYRIDWQKKMLRSIENTYRRAPFFDEVYPLINLIINSKYEYISDLSIESIVKISRFLEIKTNFIKSSDLIFNRSDEAVENIYSICEIFNATTYINAEGGKKLYNRIEFSHRNLELYFLESIFLEYKQFSSSFYPGLSIIDLLMFNSKQEIIDKHFNSYKLV